MSNSYSDEPLSSSFRCRVDSVGKPSPRSGSIEQNEGSTRRLPWDQPRASTSPKKRRARAKSSDTARIKQDKEQYMIFKKLLSSPGSKALEGYFGYKFVPETPEWNFAQSRVNIDNKKTGISPLRRHVWRRRIAAFLELFFDVSLKNVNGEALLTGGGENEGGWPNEIEALERLAGREPSGPFSATEMMTLSLMSEIEVLQEDAVALMNGLRLFDEDYYFRYDSTMASSLINYSSPFALLLQLPGVTPNSQRLNTFYGGMLPLLLDSEHFLNGIAGAENAVLPRRYFVSLIHPYEPPMMGYRHVEDALDAAESRYLESTAPDADPYNFLWGQLLRSVGVNNVPSGDVCSNVVYEDREAGQALRISTAQIMTAGSVDPTLHDLITTWVLDQRDQHQNEPYRFYASKGTPASLLTFVTSPDEVPAWLPQLLDAIGVLQSNENALKKRSSCMFNNGFYHLAIALGEDGQRFISTIEKQSDINKLFSTSLFVSPHLLLRLRFRRKLLHLYRLIFFVSKIRSGKEHALWPGKGQQLPEDDRFLLGLVDNDMMACLSLRSPNVSNASGTSTKVLSSQILFPKAMFYNQCNSNASPERSEAPFNASDLLFEVNALSQLYVSKASLLFDKKRQNGTYYNHAEARLRSVPLNASILAAEQRRLILVVLRALLLREYCDERMRQGWPLADRYTSQSAHMKAMAEHSAFTLRLLIFISRQSHPILWQFISHHSDQRNKSRGVPRPQLLFETLLGKSLSISANRAEAESHRLQDWIQAWLNKRGRRARSMPALPNSSSCNSAKSDLFRSSDLSVIPTRSRSPRSNGVNDNYSRRGKTSVFEFPSSALTEKGAWGSLSSWDNTVYSSPHPPASYGVNASTKSSGGMNWSNNPYNNGRGYPSNDSNVYMTNNTSYHANVPNFNFSCPMPQQDGPMPHAHDYPAGRSEIVDQISNNTSRLKYETVPPLLLSGTSPFSYANAKSNNNYYNDIAASDAANKRNLADAVNEQPKRYYNGVAEQNSRMGNGGSPYANNNYNNGNNISSGGINPSVGRATAASGNTSASYYGQGSPVTRSTGAHQKYYSENAGSSVQRDANLRVSLSNLSFDKYQGLSPAERGTLEEALLHDLSDIMLNK